jgi:hypothetical protein
MAIGRESCGRHAPVFGWAEEKESNALVFEGDGHNNQHNFINRARKKLIMELINFIIVFTPCRKPPRHVLYKCTYVPYDGTFVVSNQEQTLDV